MKDEIYLAFGSRIWFRLSMGRLPKMPNGEICSLAELDTAAGPTRSRRSHVRLMAIKALLLGGSHDYVAELYGVSRKTLCT